MSLQLDAVRSQIAETWKDELIPQLVEYVAIPALSPAFDPNWEATGEIERAVQQIEGWIASRNVAGMQVEVQRLPGLTPLIVVEVDAFNMPDGASDKTVVLYGHLDKQPEMEGWREDLGPWKPVLEDGKLYGRGGADDGYAAFASLTAIEAVQRNGGRHARCVLLVEASEESGSPDLPAHIDALADRLGDVELVMCLDSGCMTYETLWLTTSLRGMVMADVQVDIVTEGLHSGAVGGVVPSSFRIMRQLLDRIEDSSTGRFLLDSAIVDIPEGRVQEAAEVAGDLGWAALENPPMVEGARLAEDDVTEALIAKTWRPSLSVVGADGMPPTAKAGNVLRPFTRLKLSIRVPPTASAAVVLEELQRTLETSVPYGARVSIEHADSADGWEAPPLVPWLSDALNAASQVAFDKPMRLYGEGGTIPFMGMLGEKFPAAQFVITGVLGPASNAHGPNEFLHLDYAERLTNCLASVLDAHTRREG